MTARLYHFPRHRSRPHLSIFASTILHDMRRRAGADGLVQHSIAHGIECTGTTRDRVVEARRELQERGLVERVGNGDGRGPTVWRLQQSRLEPDGTA